ncbi:MAG: FMN-binding protein [candidate division WWE3 bacterium]|nr:FMN-binding protein [candidate division WWE3 bacterium]
MKKILLSVVVVSAFIFYSLTQQGNSATVPVIATVPTTTPQAPVMAPPTTPAVIAPPARPPMMSKYKDGTFIGSVADAYYGNIQVAAVIKNGKLTAVNFLQYPSDRSRSIEINKHAMPLLSQEAISAQSNQVDGVSGASDSSAAFVQSLGDALASALN